VTESVILNVKSVAQSTERTMKEHGSQSSSELDIKKIIESKDEARQQQLQRIETRLKNMGMRVAVPVAVLTAVNLIVQVVTAVVIFPNQLGKSRAELAEAVGRLTPDVKVKLDIVPAPHGQMLRASYTNFSSGNLRLLLRGVRIWRDWHVNIRPDQEPDKLLYSNIRVSSDAKVLEMPQPSGKSHTVSRESGISLAPHGDHEELWGPFVLADIAPQVEAKDLTFEVKIYVINHPHGGECVVESGGSVAGAYPVVTPPAGAAEECYNQPAHISAADPQGNTAPSSH
jgi:hypothetical protein